MVLYLHSPMRWYVVLLLLLVLGVPPVPMHAASRATPPPPASSIRYIAATGHTLRDPVQRFYDAHDGPALFGNPLTEVVTDHGVQVQYFERQVVEINANQVSLLRLGSLFTQDRVNTPPFVWLAESPDPSRRFFAASGHTLGGAFAWFWDAHGGMAVLGYPISEEYNDENGMVTQYFERARLTYHTDTTPAVVQMAALGQQYVAFRGVPAAALAPVSPIVTLAEARLPIAASASHNVALAAQRLDGLIVAPGATGSFLRQIGEVSTRAGYVTGQAISGGKIVNSVGGGICYVSTVLYHAVLHAGLDVVERRPHSVVVRSLATPPGLDAAVDWPGADFRFRNDTGNPVTVTTSFDGSTLIVRLVGQADGRQAQLGTPQVTRYDDGGSQVQTLWTVARANGKVWKRSTIVARYVPIIMSTPEPTSTPTSAPTSTPVPSSAN